MRRDRLTAGSIYGSQRSLWCELPEVSIRGIMSLRFHPSCVGLLRLLSLLQVKSAGVLDELDNRERKLQEAYFEVITSEASYHRSITFLVTNFMAAQELMGKLWVNQLAYRVGPPLNQVVPSLDRVGPSDPSDRAWDSVGSGLLSFSGSKNPQSVITNAERKHLFSNILAIRDCSEK